MVKRILHYIYISTLITIAIILIVALTGCTDPVAFEGPGLVQCTVDDTSNAAGNIITCGNTTGLLKHGVDGKNGLNGKAGLDGADGVNGRPGINGKDGKDGKNGIDGMDGKNGVDGKDGVGVKETIIRNGKLYIVYTTGVTVLVGTVKGKDGKDGLDGKPGKDGKDGEDGSLLKTTPVPSYGVCVDLGGGVFVKNEGEKVDIYDNDKCSHKNNGVYCDNLRENYGISQGICWVGKRQFSVVGRYSDIVLHEIVFK